MDKDSRIAELEDGINYLLVHAESFQLIDAIHKLRKLMGRETFYIEEVQ